MPLTVLIKIQQMKSYQREFTIIFVKLVRNLFLEIQQALGSYSARLETLAPQAYKLGKMLSLLEFTLIGDSNADQLIDWVFRYFTNISLHDLTLIKPVKVSGTTTHQMRARSFNETIMPNELPNWYVLDR